MVAHRRPPGPDPASSSPDPGSLWPYLAVPGRGRRPLVWPTLLLVVGGCGWPWSAAGLLCSPWWGCDCADARPAGGRACLAVLLRSPAVGARLDRRSRPRVRGYVAALAGGGCVVVADALVLRWFRWWACPSLAGLGAACGRPSVGAGRRACHGVPWPLDPVREWGRGESLGLLADQ